MRIFLGVVALVVLVAALLIEWPGVSHGGTLLEESFLGPITQRTVSYNIYLPDGYENGNEHYPVVYHLHGLGGDQGGGQNTVVPQSFEAARQAGVIGPVIIVFPNGYVDSFWADAGTARSRPKPTSRSSSCPMWTPTIGRSRTAAAG